jgi:hypothetical protein
MQVNIREAVKRHYPKPSLETVYLEAVANAIDAGATEINIQIEINAYPSHESLAITIDDNGEGFIDLRFKKFSKLYETQDGDGHKGLGRLIYLAYFEKVEVESRFDNLLRSFTFSDKFEGEKDKTDKIQMSTNSGTKLRFTGYLLKKIDKKDYIRPSYLENWLRIQTLPQLFASKQIGKEIKISITLNVDEDRREDGLINETRVIDSRNLTDLSTTIIEPGDHLTVPIQILFSVKKQENLKSLKVAYVVDGRAIMQPFVSNENVPNGHEAIFLVYSDLLVGSSNARTKVKGDKNSLMVVESLVKKRIREILDVQVPEISTRNIDLRSKLENRFPHFQGYFDSVGVGLMQRKEALDAAQKRFFDEQRHILDAQTLDDELYQEAIAHSSRVLAEYVLYRNITIQRLKQTTSKETEGVVHNMIVPKGGRFLDESTSKDIFSNNAWLLDDKFMTYSVVLSDRELKELFKDLAIDRTNNRKGSDRPDIAVVFSQDPKIHEVEVVIAELKRKGVGLANKESVISQLRQRARVLLNHYNGKIRRIWLYGIVDFDDDFLRSLREEKWNPIFSHGEVWYREFEIEPDGNPSHHVVTGLHLISYDALTNDAEARNQTFLSLLRESIKNSCR